ncbi:MAG: fused MFS/spermidine synthase [Phycisphaerae bacterium]
MNRSATRYSLLLIFLLSGATGLVYQLVWVRMLTLVFGGTTYAITTVLVAFMGGLGLGSFIAGKIAPRVAAPGRAYGWLEIAIGAYALAVPLLFQLVEPLYRAMYSVVGDAPFWLTAARFLVGALFLILPTTAMGATLPLLVQYIGGKDERVGRSVGTLYGINTLGAFGGTILAGFWLIPTLGVAATTWTTSLANLLLGSAAIALFRGPRLDPAAPAVPRTAAVANSVAAQSPPALATDNRDAIRTAVLATFAISGFCSMVYQIAWTRALVMCFGSTTYSFTCILAAFILGLAIGSLVVARFLDRAARPARIAGWLQLAIGLSAVCIAPLYDTIPLLVYQWVGQLSGNYSALIGLQFAIIIAVTFVPTAMMGALFPLVTRTLAATADDAAAATGRAYGINTIGTICGAFIAGFVLIRGEVLGALWSINLAAVMNALLGVWLIRATGVRSEPIQHGPLPAMGGLAAVVLAATMFGSWDIDTLATGSFRPGNDPVARKREFETKYYADGVDTTVSIVQSRTQPHLIALTVNGKPDASTVITDMHTQLLLAHIPTMITPRLENACMIGLGSGISLGALSRYQEFKQIDCVELCEEVVLASNAFTSQNHDVLLTDPRVRMLTADGRNHLLLTEQRYSVILSQPSNPWIAGVSNLFTREFFELCKSRLQPDGTLAVWMQSYALTFENFQMVVRTLRASFPQVEIWQTHESDVILTARSAPARMSLDVMLPRFYHAPVQTDVYRIGMQHLGRVLGCCLIGGKSIDTWLQAGPIHTDDNAILEFDAPRNLYLPPDNRIAESLISIASDPLPLVVDIERATTPQQRRIIQQAADAREARRLLNAATIARNMGATEDEQAEILLQAHQRDPGSLLIALRTLECVDRLAIATALNVPAARRDELVRHMHDIRLPTFTYPNVIPVMEVPDFLFSRATDELARGLRAHALASLTDALSINPDRMDVLLQLVNVTALDDRPAALALLDTAVAESRLTREQIATAEPLTDLRISAEFAAWARQPASQPTSAAAPKPASTPANGDSSEKR